MGCHPARRGRRGRWPAGALPGCLIVGVVALVTTASGLHPATAIQYLGSTGGMRLNSPIVGMATTRSGAGYWLVAGDGGIFSFGDASFRGSTGAIHLNKPVVGMAATPTGGGYWITTAAGDVFTFGNAVLYGSTGGVPLTQPIVGMAGPRQGGGYWLVARDGGIFSFPGVPPPPPSTSYAWMATNNDGSPVRYNPCQVVHYVVNLSEAPARALTDVESSLGRISAATGIPFAYDGTTSELPSTNRAA